MNERTDGRTGRDVPRTNIYTGIMAPDSRGVYNKSTQYCPFITRRPSLMRALHVYMPVWLYMYYNIMSTCVFGDSFFFVHSVRLILIFRNTTRRVVKKSILLYIIIIHTHTHTHTHTCIYIYYVIMNACTAVSKCLYLQSVSCYCSGNLEILYRTNHNSNMMANTKYNMNIILCNINLSYRFDKFD